MKPSICSIHLNFCTIFFIIIISIYLIQTLKIQDHHHQMKGKKSHHSSSVKKKKFSHNNNKSNKNINEKPSGISGGEPVQEGSLKFMVMLIGTVRLRPNLQYVQCTGFVVDQIHMITAGHCCYTYYNESIDPKLFYGGYNLNHIHEHYDMIRFGKRFKVTARFLYTYRKHLSNNTAKLFDDVCIIRINHPVEIGQSNHKVLPVKLAPPTEQWTEFLNNQLDLNDCWTFGYGVEWPNIARDRLNSLRLPLDNLDPSEYDLIYGFYPRPYPSHWTEPRVILDGDSGGPLLCRLKSVHRRNFNTDYITIGVSSSSRSIPMPYNSSHIYFTKFEPVQYHRNWFDNVISGRDTEPWLEFRR